MTLVPANRKVKPASLVRSSETQISYPGLDRVGEKLARGMAQFLSGLMSACARVSPKTIESEDRPEAPALARTIRLHKERGSMQVSLAPATVISLVDLYYGGDGRDADQAREVLTSAESRLFERMVSAISSLLGPAWLSYGSLEPCVDDDSPLATGPVAVQLLEVTFEGRAPFDIQCRYPISTLDQFPGLRSLDPGASALGGLDDEWQTRLLTRSLDVSVPVRAIFAEPEVSLERLIDLRIGDVVPLCLPPAITLTVAGLPFASGTAGESNGRAAISIDEF